MIYIDCLENKNINMKLKNIDNYDTFLEKKKTPSKYLKGLSPEKKKEMKEEISKNKNKDDDDSSAYKPWKADYKGKAGKSEKSAKVKESPATKAYKKMYEKKENWEKGLKNKSDKCGISYTILKQVYNRGRAAWKTGHRPSIGQDQWAMGRVNSFITGSGGARKADSDLWKKAKKQKEKKSK